MTSAQLQLETLTCPTCLQKIDAALKGLKGVDADSVNVSFSSSKVKLNFDESQVDIDAIQNAITSLGYEVKKARTK